MPAVLKPSTGNTTAAPTIGSISSSAPASAGNPTPGSPASGPAKQLPAAPAAIPAAPPAAPAKPTLGLAPRPAHKPTPKPATYGQAGSWSEPDPKTPAPMTVQPEPVPGAANQLDFGPITWSPEQIKAWGPATGPGGQTPTVPKYTVEQQRAFMSAAAGPEAPAGVPMTGKNTHNWEQAKGGLRPLLDKPEAAKPTSLNPFDVWNRTQDWKWGEGMPGHSPDLYRDAHKLPAYQFDVGHLTPEEAPHADTISAAWAANPGAAAEAASLPPARIPGMQEYAQQRNVGVYNPHFEQWWAAQGPVGGQSDADRGNPYARVRRYAETQQGEMLANSAYKSTEDKVQQQAANKAQMAEGTGFWENYTNSTPAAARGDRIQADYYKAKYEQQGYKPEEAASRSIEATIADRNINQNRIQAQGDDTYAQHLWKQMHPGAMLAKALPVGLQALMDTGDAAYGAVSTLGTVPYGISTGDWNPAQSSLAAIKKPVNNFMGWHNGDPMLQDAADATRAAGQKMVVDSANPDNPAWQRYGGQALGRTMQAATYVPGLFVGGGGAGLAARVGGKAIGLGAKAINGAARGLVPAGSTLGRAGSAVGQVAGRAGQTVANAAGNTAVQLSKLIPAPVQAAANWVKAHPVQAMSYGSAGAGVLQQLANDTGLGKLQQQAIHNLEAIRDNPETSTWLRTLADGTASTLQAPQHIAYNYVEPAIGAAVDYAAPVIDWAQGRKGVPLPSQQLRQQQQAHTQAVSQATRALIQQEFEQAGKPLTPEIMEQELQARWARQKSLDAQSRWGVDFNAPPGMPQAPPVKSPAAQAATPAVQPATAPTETAQADPLRQMLDDGLDQGELQHLMQDPALRGAFLNSDPRTQQNYIQHIDKLMVANKQTPLSESLRQARLGIQIGPPFGYTPAQMYAKMRTGLQGVFPGVQLADEELQGLLQAGQ